LEKRLFRRLEALSIQRIIFIPEIPVDKRHNAKIDYPALRIMVEKAAP
jgi:hypothetical protein